MSLTSSLALFKNPQQLHLLKGIVRGIEKESLRVTSDGHIAKTAHPKTLGSALKHPSITTDYSEALLEFITEPSSSIEQVLNSLDEIHRYTYRQIGEELLWVSSMPCQLGADNQIPVAQYGTSNIGTMKQVYRIGLGHRYGRAMQSLAFITTFPCPIHCGGSCKKTAKTSVNRYKILNQKAISVRLEISVVTLGYYFTYWVLHLRYAEALSPADNIIYSP